ncbi:Uncharacterised protein [Chlamydia trachomatis]|nr:Uncharacterised protein [Chlamydia trachomatis]CRH49020.1 Uncharacterised protein [Chlamydia trachomatis]
MASRREINACFAEDKKLQLLTEDDAEGLASDSFVDSLVSELEAICPLIIGFIEL